MTTPSWVATIADDARIDSSELAAWLGCTSGQILKGLERGNIPASEGKARKCYPGSSSRHRIHRWKAKTIRDWLKAGKPRIAK